MGKVLEREQSKIDEAIKQETEAAKDGSKDILTVAWDYARKYNGYPYISVSRIERIPDNKKGEKNSFLFDQLTVNFLAKNIASGKDDFMETFGNGKLVFIQAHASCPTLADDGLYNALDVNGNYIKTQIAGYFALNEDPIVETTDESSIPEYEYFYKDVNDKFVGIQVNDNIPLNEYYTKHGKLYRHLRRPWFEPFIVVKKGSNEFGKITGNPFPTMPTAAAATLLKKATLTELPAEEEKK